MKRKSFSLADLISRGHRRYRRFEDLPYEVRQALAQHDHDSTFESLPIRAEYLRWRNNF